VFTLPHELNVISQYAPEKLYKSLFKAVWATLSQFAMSRKTLKTINRTPILRRQEKSALPIPALVAPPLLFRL
jgi:hypothetical protein